MKARVEKNHFKPLDAFRRLGLSGNPFAQRDPWSLVPLLAPAPALVELAAHSRHRDGTGLHQADRRRGLRWE